MPLLQKELGDHCAAGAVVDRDCAEPGTLELDQHCRQMAVVEALRDLVAERKGHHDQAVEAPRELTLRVGWQPQLLNALPISNFATIVADLAAADAIPAEACYMGWGESLELLKLLVEPEINQ